jgi:hypothetical protein
MPYALGRKAPDPHKLVKAIRLKDVLTGYVPVHPPTADYIKGLRFGLYANDKFGVCGPCSVANARILVTSRLTPDAVHTPGLQDVYALYRQSGNPRFDPKTGADDDGVVMQVMLEALLKNGIGGVRPLGFARLDPDDLDELDAAIALFGQVLYGVDLQAHNEAETDRGTWTYQPGAGPWGGHAVLAGAYPADDGNDVVTWAKRVRCTDRFLKERLGEAWVVIWPEHLRDDAFLRGVDLPEFARAYEQLTGRKFPAPVVPPVVPPVAPPVTPPVTPPPEVKPMVLNGHVQTPIGKWPVALSDKVAADAVVRLELPPALQGLLEKYGRVVLAVLKKNLLALLTGKKDWKDVLWEALEAVLAEDLV